MASSTSLLTTHLKDGVREFSSQPQLRLFVMLSIGAQVFFQSHFQFWQAFFLEKGVIPEHLVNLYVGFQAVGIAAGHVSTHTWDIRQLTLIALGASPVLAIVMVWAYVADGYRSAPARRRQFPRYCRTSTDETAGPCRGRPFTLSPLPGADHCSSRLSRLSSCSCVTVGMAPVASALRICSGYLLRYIVTIISTTWSYVTVPVLMTRS